MVVLYLLQNFCAPGSQLVPTKANQSRLIVTFPGTSGNQVRQGTPRHSHVLVMHPPLTFMLSMLRTEEVA